MIIELLEKFWKKFLQSTNRFAKNDFQSNLYLDYQQFHDMLDDLKFQVEKFIEKIRYFLRKSKPIFMSIVELKYYSQRLTLANQVIVNIECLMEKTIDSFIHLVQSYWSPNLSFDPSENQKILTDIYEHSMNDWRILLNKIEKFLQRMKISH